MSTWIARLSLALLSVLALARAAAAHEPPAYVDAYGYARSYQSGAETRESRYGPVAVYEVIQDDARRDDRGPRPCDRRRPPHPDVRYSCPPGWGEITLNDSFFHGGGGVGPAYIASGGGGGGFVYVGAGAGAGAYASASASASVRVSVGGRRGGHHPPKGRGGCGCR